MNDDEILFQWYRWRCVLCLTPATGYHHLVPSSAGGVDTVYNKIPLCPACHNKVQSNWREWIPKLCAAAISLRQYFEEE